MGTYQKLLIGGYNMDINIKEFEKEIENFRDKINNSEKIIESINSASENLIDKIGEIEEIVDQSKYLQQKQLEYAKDYEKAFIECISKNNEVSDNINSLFEKYQSNIIKNQEKISDAFLGKNEELKSLINQLFNEYNENQKMFHGELFKELEMNKVLFNEIIERNMLSIHNKFKDEIVGKTNEVNILFGNLSKTLNEYLETTNQSNALLKKVKLKLNIAFVIIIILLIFK